VVNKAKQSKAKQSKAFKDQVFGLLFVCLFVCLFVVVVLSISFSKIHIFTKHYRCRISLENTIAVIEPFPSEASK